MNSLQPANAPAKVEQSTAFAVKDEQQLAFDPLQQQPEIAISTSNSNSSSNSNSNSRAGLLWPWHTPILTISIPDHDLKAWRIHYETANDAMLALRMTALSALVVVGLVILFNLITGDLIQLFRHPVLFKYVFSYNTIFAVLQVLWFVAFCIFSHLIRVNFDTPLSLIQDAFGEPAFYEQYDEQSQPLQPPQQQQQQRGTTAGGNSGELQQNPDIAASITPQQQHQQQHQQQQQTRSRKHRNTEWVSVVLPPTLPLGALNRNNDQQQQMAPLLCLATPDPADLEFRSQK